MTLQLQFKTDGMVGVYVHGQSFRNLGESRLVRCASGFRLYAAGFMSSCKCFF